MMAITIEPKIKDSLSLTQIPEPKLGAGHVLCEMAAVGICGTDRELINGDYGAAPEGQERLVIGHESLARVLESGDARYQAGDWVVPIVRRPDPVPCIACAMGEWDMCRNGLYTECGIFKRDGFACERFSVESDFIVPVSPELGLLAVLLEPCSIVAKAWEQCERIFQRSVFKPRRALVTGAGPVGLLAAMILTQNSIETHVLDRVSEGVKPELVRGLNARYHDDWNRLRESEPAFDLTIECTGAASLVAQLMTYIAPDGILCLTGVSTGGRKFGVDIGSLNREIVLENEIIFGSVNANRRHYILAEQALARADRNWLNRLITRKVPLSKGLSAYAPTKADIKTILVAG
jgi:threonine dehydrogenase-like Zn-dependent dehydrogenase